MNETVHIVVPYYRGERFIFKCVGSLLQQTVPTMIWVVDNDPSGLQHAFDPERVNVIRTKKGIGYGRAANIGVYRAISEGASKLVVSNQDVIFEREAIEKLRISNSSDIYLPVILNYGDDNLSTYFVRVSEQKNGLKVSDIDTEADREIPVKHGYGACLAFSGKLVDEIGLFDPVFLMYGEDEDLFHRVRKAGGELKLCTGSRVHHYHSDVSLEGKEKEKINALKLKAALMRLIKQDRKKFPGFFKVWSYSVLDAFKKGKFDIGLRYLGGPLTNLLSSQGISYLFNNDVQTRITRSIERDSLKG